MSDVTVKQLADVVKTPVDKLLLQLKDAGINKSSADDLVSDDEKMKLLGSLRRSHGKEEGGAAAAASKITLKRKSASTLSVGAGRNSKSVNVEVRKKRTYVQKSAILEDEAAVREAEEAKQQLVLDEEQAAAAAVIEAENAKQTEAEAKIRAAEEAKVAAEKAAKDAAEAERLAAEKAAKDAADAEAARLDPEGTAKRLAAEKKAEADKVEADKKAAAEKAKADADEAFKADRAMKMAKAAENIRREEERKARLKKKAASPAGATPAGGAAPAGAAADKGKYGRKELHVDANAKGKGRRGAKKGRGAAKRNKVVANPDNQHGFEMPTEVVARDVKVPDSISVGDLAKEMAVKATEVIKVLMKMGVMTTINQTLDQDTGMLVVEEMGHNPIAHDVEAEEQKEIAMEVVNELGATTRPPVVTIMGHVDHGKTSLLDYIRKSKVTDGEAGGITQHIGAYHVETSKGIISFLDTPGHAAFTAMRARGAQVTDIVILVVAADDGVMPQTIEAIQHAKAAEVPLIIAVNKMDKPEADPDRVKNELSQHEVIPEDWGGENIFAHISALTGDGVNALLESVSLQAELLELNAPATGPATGMVIESSLDKGRGPVATVLVQSGELKRGDTIVAGKEFGRIRAMFDENGKQVQTAGPSIPVQVLGLSAVPNAGDDVATATDERKAREIVQLRQERDRENRLAQRAASKMEDAFNRMTEGDVQTVNVLIKADVQGSVEALRESLLKLSTGEVRLNVVSAGVGGITETDALLAAASNAYLIGFNVRADSAGRKAVEEQELGLKYYSIIYEVIDDVREMMSGKLAPEVKENIVGLAEVKDVFKASGFGEVAGCIVTEGFVRKSLPIRVLRENVVVYEGELESLRRFKDDVNEVRMGTECGIAVKNYKDVKAGDQIEVFERITVERSLDA
jgi:translation initiation factor IF-2